MRKCLIFKLKKHLRKFKYRTYQHLLITGWKSQKMQIRHFIWWNGSLLKIFFCQNCKFVNVKYSESAKFNTLSNNPMSRYLGNQLICLIFTKRQEDVFQLSQHHGAVLHFVIKLQAFNEVLKGSCVFGFLHVRVDGVELSKGKPQ